MQLSVYIYAYILPNDFSYVFRTPHMEIQMFVFTFMKVVDPVICGSCGTEVVGHVASYSCGEHKGGADPERS